MSDLGLTDVPMMTVFNKIDEGLGDGGQPILSESELSTLSFPELHGLSGELCYVSATERWGIGALRERLLYEFFGSSLTLASEMP